MTGSQTTMTSLFIIDAQGGYERMSQSAGPARPGLSALPVNSEAVNSRMYDTPGRYLEIVTSDRPAAND